MVAGVWSDNNNLQLEATTQFRKLLSIGISHDPIWALIVLFCHDIFKHNNFIRGNLNIRTKSSN